MSEQTSWHTVSTEAVIDRLESGWRGLASSVISERREQLGSNRLPPPRTQSSLRTFIVQFRSPLVIILVIATAISFMIGENRDAFVIAGVILLNSLIGWRQERQSSQAVAKLLAMQQPIAHVIRDDEEREISIDEIVVGDLCVIDTGDKIPADGRWVETVNLRVNESTLTGEAVPVTKDTDPSSASEARDASCLGWRGTTVVGGRGRLIVTKVGTQTRYGSIVESLESVDGARTPFQQQMAKFATRLSLVTVFLGAIVFSIGLIRDVPVDDVFLLTVSLIVAVIPEGLPVVITMAMAWGMWAMARRQAIIRKLMAVETLGSVDIVATDKTGTLTFGEMMVERAWADGRMYHLTGRGYSTEGDIHENEKPIVIGEHPTLGWMLRLGVLNNDSRFTRDQHGTRIPVGDPTELALIVAGEKGGWTASDLEGVHPRLGEIPFDTTVKHMVTWHRQEDGILGTLKGAPIEVLEHCARQHTDQGTVPLTPAAKAEIIGTFERWAKEGLRGLAIANIRWSDAPDPTVPNSIGHEFIFVGLFGMADAVRPEAAETIEQMRQAGIRTIMLTGDYQKTGVAIARRIGLISHEHGQYLLDGGEIDRLDDQALDLRLRTAQVATRLTPDQKLRIAKRLQANHHIVAMTGDGINDAPALAAANVGIAVGMNASDAAKEAADMVLVNGNYASIFAAVVEGRRIFRNIRRAVVYLVASNFSLLGLIVITLLFGYPVPLLPTQIIWLNVITDPFLGMALAREPISPLIEKAKPRPYGSPFLPADVWRRMFVSALVLTLTSLTVFLIAINQGLAERDIFTLTLTVCAVTQWVFAFTARSSIRSSFRTGVPNPSLVIAFVSVLALHVAVLYTPALAELLHVNPLPLSGWGIVALSVIPIVAVEEIGKAIRRRRYRDGESVII